MKIFKLIFTFLLAGTFSLAAQVGNFRAPSYPLVTCDPYFSIWSGDEIPTRFETTHWTGKPMPIHVMVRIDGKIFRLMGKLPAFEPAAKCISSEVSPTSTLYTYQESGVEIKLSFLSPLLAEDIDLVSRPLSYVSWSFTSADKKAHSAEIYFDISGLACVDNRSQTVVFNKQNAQQLEVLKIGSKEQPVLQKSGDDLRIDWGYLYAAIPSGVMKSSFAGRRDDAMQAFTGGQLFPGMVEADQGKRAGELNAVLAFIIPVSIPAQNAVEKHLLLAYDDILSVEYFGKKLEGYWHKKFSGIDELLLTGEKEYESIKTRCALYDKDLLAKAEKIGGKEYSAICALAYRQCMAAHKVVKGENGEPLCFSKENFSNGSMGTVDVFYPAAPFFLYLNPVLIKAQSTPIFEYAESGRWPWPYAPHDIGKYPLGNGQKYGGGEKTEDGQMPVEECGNMIILAGAIAKTEGNADYAAKYWKTITKWAEYLKEKGFDPENQLCTDDFAGHLAHNANLSVKAIMGLASYASLCGMRGLNAEATAYKKIAADLAQKWVIAAEDGDHFRLAFDKPGSWSQKYNMVWDEILGFNLFPKQVKDKEIAYYLKMQNHYGLPLDNREGYTKLDWIIWTATMAGSKQQFSELIKPVYNFLNETPDRVPMTDWYWTRSGEMRGFQARSVVGGVYIKLLKEKLK
ncbi:MAG: DUF4965 domain-containing protein [Prolixibacteraceae bacterium]